MRIEVRHGDTDEVPRGGGTGGSKSLQVGGSAVWEASEAAVAKAKREADIAISRELIPAVGRFGRGLRFAANAVASAQLHTREFAAK